MVDVDIIQAMLLRLFQMPILVALHGVAVIIAHGKMLLIINRLKGRKEELIAEYPPLALFQRETPGAGLKNRAVFHPQCFHRAKTVVIPCFNGARNRKIVVIHIDQRCAVILRLEADHRARVDRADIHTVVPLIAPFGRNLRKPAAAFAQAAIVNRRLRGERRAQADFRFTIRHCRKLRKILQITLPAGNQPGAHVQRFTAALCPKLRPSAPVLNGRRLVGDILAFGRECDRLIEQGTLNAFHQIDAFIKIALHLHGLQPGAQPDGAAQQL